MKTVLLAAAFTTLLFSCRKSSDEPSYTHNDVLGKYKITKLLFQSNGHPDQDLLADLPACAQDDLLVFGDDSIFKKEDGAVSCGEPAEEPVNWYTKGKKMYIDGVASEIVSFDKHTLVLATTMDFFGVQGTVMETLERQ
jgi:hypothetical protein